MTSTSTVTVYNFKVFDGNAENPRVMGFKAPRAVIESRFGGEILEGTAESVSLSELDDTGCFRRLRTGWGEL